MEVRFDGKRELNCLLAGVGGQGTVLASKLIAASFMKKGFFARTAETIGMAQRGGCVVSHVRVGETIHSPLIPIGEADIIIGFEPAEAVRCLPYLKEGGTVVVSSHSIKPVTDALSNASYEGEEMLGYLRQQVKRSIVVDTDAICRECGSPKVVNLALTGAAIASGCLILTLSDLEDTLVEKVAKKYVKMNRLALHMGAKSGRMEMDRGNMG